MKSLTRSFLAFAAALFLTASAITIVYAQECVGICNPLRFDNIQDFVAGALKALVIIALPILAFFIVYSGFLFISARGNSSKLGEAKQNFLYVIIGAVLILGAWILATLIGGTVSQLTG